MTSDAHTLAHRIRRTVIEQSYRAHVGHIGSALCIADLLAALYGGVLRTGDGPDRDRMILSKGHAALALYAALEASGRISRATLDTFCADGTALGAHPEHVVAGIDFSTGSLGQGLSIGAGAALAARMQGSQRRTFVLLSDAEMNEGSVWEAVMFAAHQQLGRLIAILDLNGQQALGYTRDVLGERLDVEPEARAKPRLIVARTTFGKGVSYMQSRIEWHYLPMSEEHFSQAMEELEMESAAEQGARA